MAKHYEYKTIFSKRRTVSISVNREAEVVVKAPFGISDSFIDSFVQKQSKWIEKQKAKIAENGGVQPLSAEDIERLKAEARKTLPEYAAFWGSVMNVKPAEIKITSAQKRWGSCTWNNTLCFPYRIMLLPKDLIECIVVHELAHIRIKNHSPEFYKYIEHFMPDYRERAKKLKVLSLTV